MKKTLLSLLLSFGVISSQAALFQYSISFSDAGEPQASPGAGGFGTADYDSTLHTFSLSATFSGLQGNTTASHIHAPTVVAGTGTAGVATTTPSLAGFPLGVMNGTFSNTLDLTLASSWNNAYVTANGGIAGAEAAFATALVDGKAYWNIHSSFGPGGEIRGFLTPVPEPGTLALAVLGALGLVASVVLRRRRSA